MIKRWIKNIKWLFNHPPVTINSNIPEDATCDYCGAGLGVLWHCENIYCICEHCRKKVFDSVLKKGE